MAVLAATALLPPYASLAAARYERDSQRAAVADLESLAAANEELIAALKEGDPVLTKRLAMSMLRMRPNGETVARLCGSDGAAQDIVLISRHPRPDPPKSWLLQLAERFRNVNLRRGLLAVASGALAVALLVFFVPGRGGAA